MKRKFIIVIDGSYWLYYTIFGAVGELKKSNPEVYDCWLKPAKETDQENLPHIINCPEFKKILKQFVMKRCETVDWLSKQNCQDAIDTCDSIDIIFAEDDILTHSFRKKLYPEYKAQRALENKQFDVPEVKEYVMNVLWPELELTKKYGWKRLKVECAEGDDVIACILRNFSKDYIECLLIASDHDFLQIDGDNIVQFDLNGVKAERKIAKDYEVLSAKDFLLSKILLGDKSDNISNVFYRCGPVKVSKLLKDKQQIKVMLESDQNAVKQYKLNKQLISFDEVPKELTDKINEKISETLYSNEILNEKSDTLIQLLDL